jgi:large subunit ribosomal protein L30
VRKKTPSAKVKKLRLKLVRSPIGYPQKQRATVLGLGLRRLNSEVIRPDSPEIRGMIAKVSHLLRVESLEE